ncbi:MAG TPA: hypothetical protein VFQ38_14845 [Longimicrobiales bacterium]|nr:hypothetical protein [Longimicrobiales bacterium]
MKRIELTSGEAEVLRDVLANYLGELRVEVHRTDHFEFRQQLKEKAEILRVVLERLARSA